MSSPCSNLALRPLLLAEGRHVGPLVASMDPWKTLGYGAKALSLYLTKSDTGLERLAIVAAGRLVGVLCVRFPWLRGPFVELLAVFPGDQARGLGREVLARVEAEPRWAGPNVWVTVSGFNGKARSFYERCGYREVAVLPRLVAPDGEERLLRKEVGGVADWPAPPK